MIVRKIEWPDGATEMTERACLLKIMDIINRVKEIKRQKANIKWQKFIHTFAI
jgi:hypothetical protein